MGGYLPYKGNLSIWGAGSHTKKVEVRQKNQKFDFFIVLPRPGEA